MALKLYSPDVGMFIDLDSGHFAQGTLLLNILIELRVQTDLILACNPGVVKDDVAALRADVISDPASFTTL